MCCGGKRVTRGQGCARAQSAAAVASPTRPGCTALAPAPPRARCLTPAPSTARPARPSRPQQLEALVVRHSARLVVVDSIAALARAEFGGTGTGAHSHNKDSDDGGGGGGGAGPHHHHHHAGGGGGSIMERQELLGVVASALKHVAEAQRLPVLVTNQVLRAGGLGGRVWGLGHGLASGCVEVGVRGVCGGAGWQRLSACVSQSSTNEAGAMCRMARGALGGGGHGRAGRAEVEAEGQGRMPWAARSHGVERGVCVGIASKLKPVIGGGALRAPPGRQPGAWTQGLGFGV